MSGLFYKYIEAGGLKAVDDDEEDTTSDSYTKIFAC